MAADAEGRRLDRAIRGRREGRAAADAGATLIEAAIAAIAFFTLLFAIFEGSLLVNGHLTIAATTTDGARAAAVSGSSLDADWRIIRAVAGANDAVRTEIVRVVVFKASGPDSAAPAGCRAGTPSLGGVDGMGACNVYTPGAHFSLTDPAEFDCDASSPSHYYCPTTRKTAVQGPNGPPDYVGVYVQMQHSYLTGMFGSGVPITRTSVVRLEPRTLNG
jgi:hypothetical protein